MKQISYRGVNALLLASLLLLAGCITQTPVGVNEVSPQQAYQYAHANPLSQGILSGEARYVLNRHFLLQKFENDPKAAIADLHAIALRDERRDILYTLSEMSYIYASNLVNSYDSNNKKSGPDYFLLSAMYIYYFVFDQNRPVTDSYKASAYNAMDMYNYALWQAFATRNGDGLLLNPGQRKLPFGSVSISLDDSRLPGKVESFEKFLAADSFITRGVSVRNRTQGAGVPLIAVRAQQTNNAVPSTFPVTVFLRIGGGFDAMSAGKATATLELYSAMDSRTVTVQDRVLPLGTDTTAPLAYKLEDSVLFDLNLGAFLGRDVNIIPDGLYIRDNYHQPGKIPIVLVHGTASNPAWWMEMLNTLIADPQVREHYEFWYFVYSSNKATLISAAELRDALRDKVHALDPQGKDPALQEMVVIGHSQGGLLTKLTAVEANDRLLRVMTGKSIEQMDLSAASADRVRKYFYIEPLPFVKTVVFMSTPHRGSFQSKQWVRGVVRWLITLPVNIVQTSQEYFEYITDDVKRIMGIGRGAVLTSADSMSPNNPVLKELAEIPLAPGIDGHSIIAVLGDGDPKKGNDGVVEYSSAHLEGMKSEFIVRSDHSSQLNPLAIDEVRRILVENLTAAPALKK